MIWEWITDYSFLVVVTGASLIGLFSGIFGCFVVLKQQSLLGDSIAHAALPGIALAFLIFQTKHPLFILLGAMILGLMGALLISAVVHFSQLKEDSAMGVVLSVFFGFGIFFLTIIQRLPAADKSGLNTYLFGSAATLLKHDVIVMAVIGTIVLFPLIVFWKEWKMMVFDRDFARANGVPVFGLDLLLVGVVVIVIVLGLQTVGVVLMSALLIAPAAAARQWTDSLLTMVVLSGFLGLISSIIGTGVSSVYAHMATGPVIVVVISSVMLISLLIAPKRGVVWGYLRLYLHQRSIQGQAMLANMMLFSEVDKDPFHAHDIAALTAIGRGPARRALKSLEKNGWVSNPHGDFYALTASGLAEAERLKYEADTL